jgi:L-alanine-DL-glutamate epimerase-like enolase superfamily enzyme
VAELAVRRGVQIAPHSFYFGPGFIATLHLMAALPGCTYIEVAGCSLETPLLQEPLNFRDGTIGVPEGPGLGVTLNNEVIGRYPYISAGQSLNVSE